MVKSEMTLTRKLLRICKIGFGRSKGWHLTVRKRLNMVVEYSEQAISEVHKILPARLGDDIGPDKFVDEK